MFGSIKLKFQQNIRLALKINSRHSNTNKLNHKRTRLDSLDEAPLTSIIEKDEHELNNAHI